MESWKDMNEREKKAIENIKYNMTLLYGEHNIVSNEDLKILLKLLESCISKDKIREKIESRKQRLIKGKISYTNKIRLNELNNLEKTLLEE